jgi:hypothetical protein
MGFRTPTLPIGHGSASPVSVVAACSPAAFPCPAAHTAWFTGLTPQLSSQFEGYVKDPDLRTQLGRVVASRGVGTLHLELQVGGAPPSPLLTSCPALPPSLPPPLPQHTGCLSFGP